MEISDKIIQIILSTPLCPKAIIREHEKAAKLIRWNPLWFQKTFYKIIADWKKRDEDGISSFPIKRGSKNEREKKLLQVSWQQLIIKFHLQLNFTQT